MPKNNFKTPFDKSLEAYAKEGPLTGLEDFVNKVPLLISKKLTQCGTVDLINNVHVEDTLGKMKRELPYCICYRDFRIYIGFMNSPRRGIITRIEKPSNIGKKLKKWIKQDLLYYFENSNYDIFRDYMSPYPVRNKVIIQKDYKDKFKIGNISDLKGKNSLKIELLLIDQKDAVEGVVMDYWYSYWAKVMRPIMTTIGRYHIIHKPKLQKNQTS